MSGRGCSITGCLGVHKARGWCQMHYIRWKNHGDPLKRRSLFVRGTASRSVLVAGKPCREYQGKLNPAGYARVDINGKTVMLHRWVVEQIEGPLKPFPEEIVMHHCDNPPCFLYDHLQRATLFDNMSDAEVKGRIPHLYGMAHPNAKLSDEQVAQVRSLRDGGETFQAIADRFGVSKTLVRKITTGQYRMVAP